MKRQSRGSNRIPSFYIVFARGWGIQHIFPTQILEGGDIA